MLYIMDTDFVLKTKIQNELNNRNLNHLYINYNGKNWFINVYLHFYQFMNQNIIN